METIAQISWLRRLPTSLFWGKLSLIKKLFVGRNGLGDWAREELLVAQDRAAKERSFGLIPILLAGVPNPFDYAFWES
jgi:hypothetical protein